MLQNYFERFGHKCQLHLDNPFEKYTRNKNRYQLWFLRNSVISSEYILRRSTSRSCSKLRKEMINQLENFPHAFHPFSKITFLCETIWMITTFMALVLIPINVFKHVSSVHVYYEPKYFQMMLGLFGVFDVIRRFFTGYLIQYHDRDEVVLDCKKIFIHYIKTYFWIDLLSSLPSILRVFYANSINYYVALELLSILKIFRISTVSRVINNVMLFCGFESTVHMVVIWLIQLSFVVHWVSCLTVFAGVVARKYDSDEFQWFNLIENSTVIDMYASSLHRTISIITGNGFKFIQGNEVFETRIRQRVRIPIIDMLYTLFLAILGHILTVIIISRASEILHSIRSSVAKYDDMIYEIQNYTDSQDLPATTKNKIKTYYAYKYEHSYFNENAILEDIPNELRQNILLHYAKVMLDNMQYFKGLPATIVANLISHLRREIIMTGDVVFNSGDKGATMFFIISGTIASFTPFGRELDHFEEGTYFGQLVLVTKDSQGKHVTSKVALETTELFLLKASYFYPLKEYCPDLVKQMELIARERVDTTKLVEERFVKLLDKQAILQQKGDSLTD